MKVAILGFGAQGRAALEYWGGQGHEVTVCEQNEQVEVPEGITTRLGEQHLEKLDEFDLIVRSPIVHPKDIVAANHEAILDKVTTVTNEFFKVCPTKNIIGVTGTKGKGTTSTLIARMLEAAGHRVHLGGNIGIPPLEMLKADIQPDDWVVLELANFQLIDLKYSPPIAVCLMVVPEHQDWHSDVEEYIEAKKQLFRWQTPEDIAIYFADNQCSKQIVDISQGQKIPFFTPPGAVINNDTVSIDNQVICKTDEIKLLGRHNWQNICAAVTAVWQVTQDTEAMKSVITSFSGLEHRLEFVRELDGVKYYDDSFGTTPETATVALQAFEQPKVIILGGSTKGSDFNTLAQIITKNNVRQVILMGNPTHPHYKLATPEIETALLAHGFSSITSLIRPGGSTMQEVVQVAHKAASPGSVVVLSAACASFDMFKNYKDRGEQFKKAVQNLK